MEEDKDRYLGTARRIPLTQPAKTMDATTWEAKPQPEGATAWERAEEEDAPSFSPFLREGGGF